MTLREALKDINVDSSVGSLDTEVTGLTYNSRLVKPGSIFIALRGLKADGHQYLEQARLAGAAALVVDSMPDRNWEVPVIRVQDTRAAMARIAANFYGNPSRELKTIAVTGTNGKTTSAWLMHHLCELTMFRSGLIGTIGYYIGDRAHEAERTTPESPELQRMLREIVDSGARAAVFEASSHAIVQHRVAAVDMTVLVFTNLSQDHLDYHGTMEEYYKAKAAGFHQLAWQTERKGTAVINIDDHYGRRLVKELRDAYGKDLRILTYGLNGQADFQALDFQASRQGQQFALQALGRSYLVRSPLLGRFNLYNTLAAIAAIQCLGVDIRTAIKALPSVPQVPGRMQLVPAQTPYTVFVDYAHTDDALANVLKSCRELPHRNIRVVFGCGGDRDRAKRPKMAQAAEHGADAIYVTSDNPRSEAPEAILAEVVKGLRRPAKLVEVDRRAAIHAAIKDARDGDIVLIAGKGHETYQELATGKIDFDDAKVAQEAIRATHETLQMDKLRARQVEIEDQRKFEEAQRVAREEARKPRRSAADVARERAAAAAAEGTAPTQEAEPRKLSAKDVARRRVAQNWLRDEEGIAPTPPKEAEKAQAAAESALVTEPSEQPAPSAPTPESAPPMESQPEPPPSAEEKKAQAAAEPALLEEGAEKDGNT